MAASFGPDELPPGSSKTESNIRSSIRRVSDGAEAADQAGWNCGVSCNRAGPEWSNSTMVWLSYPSWGVGLCVDQGESELRDVEWQSPWNKQVTSWFLARWRSIWQHQLLWMTYKISPGGPAKMIPKEFVEIEHSGVCICGGLCFRPIF